MQKPAARMGDLHACPVTAPTVHTGGPIIGFNEADVWIGSQPAARLGDECLCAGPIDKITTGSMTVFIKGKPAARQHDRCLHGGRITTGCVNVLIGGISCIQSETGDECYVPLILSIPDGFTRKYRIPWRARRDKIVTRAIQDAITILNAKLDLLKKDDPVTIEEFRKWFGKTDKWSKYTITVRIRKEIIVMQRINAGNFRVIGDEEATDHMFARIIPFDETRTIYLGIPFWKAKFLGKESRAGTLIHELSHYHDIGATEDHVYGERDCLQMAVNDPDNALINADNFQFFMES